MISPSLLSCVILRLFLLLLTWFTGDLRTNGAAGSYCDGPSARSTVWLALFHPAIPPLATHRVAGKGGQAYLRVLANVPDNAQAATKPKLRVGYRSSLRRQYYCGTGLEFELEVSLIPTYRGTNFAVRPRSPWLEVTSLTTAQPINSGSVP